MRNFKKIICRNSRNEGYVRDYRISHFASGTAFSQSRFSRNEVSINGFRNSTVGLEFRHSQLSYHAGYYPTAFKAGETTSFLKVGVTSWFLPVGKKENPSSFYAGASYLRGMSPTTMVKMPSV